MDVTGHKKPVMVNVGFLFKVWCRSIQLFTQNLPHKVITVDVLGNGICVALQLLKTSHPVCTLKLTSTLDKCY